MLSGIALSAILAVIVLLPFVNFASFFAYINFPLKSYTITSALPSLSDSSRIGLIGHSEGGLVATLVSAGNADIAWIVLMASPGVNGEDILYSQGQLIIAAEGGNEEAKRQQRLLQEHVFAKARELKPSDEVDPFVTDVVDKIIAASKGVDSKGAPEKNESDETARNGRIVLTEMVRANLNAMNDPWFRFFARYEPGPDLRKIKCPVLAINGEKDVQVDPKLNLSKIESSLKAGGNNNFAIKELPGLNHLFQTWHSKAFPNGLSSKLHWADRKRSKARGK